MWSIGLIANEPLISKSCARDLFKAQSYDGEVWNDLDEVTDDEGHLAFNPDHNEGMDCLDHNDRFTAVLCRHRVKGDICFGSLEGDNAGTFWGYRFDGDGNVTLLEGKLVFTETKKATPEPATKQKATRRRR